LWLHSLKVAQLLRSAACLHTNQSRSYLNHLVNIGVELNSIPPPNHFEICTRVLNELCGILWAEVRQS